MEQVYPNERLSVAMGVILPPPQKKRKKKSVEKGLSLEKSKIIQFSRKSRVLEQFLVKEKAFERTKFTCFFFSRNGSNLPKTLP